MAIPTRASRPGTFFITTATYNRRRLFQVPTNAELFVATLQHYRAEGHYKLHAFVVMPDHIHLLLTPHDIALERAVGIGKFIKGGFSHRLASKLPVCSPCTEEMSRIRESVTGYSELVLRQAAPILTHRIVPKHVMWCLDLCGSETMGEPLTSKDGPYEKRSICE